MWIALYINCTYGKFIPHGPFNTEAEAEEFCNTQAKPTLWGTFEVHEVGTGVDS